MLEIRYIQEETEGGDPNVKNIKNDKRLFLRGNSRKISQRT